jgi:hypothetical protein
MPEFFCCICHDSFFVPERALERHRGWRPKYCVAHKDIAKSRSKPGLGRHFADAARQARQEQSPATATAVRNSPRVVRRIKAPTAASGLPANACSIERAA